MTFDNHQISGRQCRRSLLTELFGISVFLLTSSFTKLYGANCFQMLLTGGFVALLLGFYYYYLAGKQTLAYGKQVAQAFPRTGCIIAIIYCIRFSIRGGFLVSMFYFLLDGYLIKDASFRYIAIPIILVSAYGAFHGREKRLRTMEMLLWFVLIPFAIVMLFLVKDVDLSNFKEEYASNIRNITEASETVALGSEEWKEEDGTGIRDRKESNIGNSQKWMGMFYPVALFSNIEFLLFLIPKIRIEDRSRKNMVIPVVSAVICNFILMFLVVGNLGYLNCIHLQQPVLRVMQSICLPGAFLKRIDILVLAFWIASVFGVLSGCIFYSGRMLRDNWNYLKSRTFYPWELGLVAILVYGCSLFWNQFAERFSLYMAYSIFLDIPLGMFLAWLVRRKNTDDINYYKRKGKWGNTKWSKAFVLFAVLLAGNSMMSGCAKMTDVEDWDYVLTLGIDEGEYTFGINTGEDTKIVSVTAQNLGEAVRKYEDTHVHSIQLGHLVAVVLGESYLPDELKLRTEKAVLQEEETRTKNQTPQEENDKANQQGEERVKLHINRHEITLTEEWKNTLEELENKKEIPIRVSLYTVTQKAKEAIGNVDYETQTLGEYLDEVYANNRQKEQKELALQYYQEAIYQDKRVVVAVIEVEKVSK